MGQVKKEILENLQTIQDENRFQEYKHSLIDRLQEARKRFLGITPQFEVFQITYEKRQKALEDADEGRAA